MKDSGVEDFPQIISPWRGDSMLEDGDGDVDLTGGYFDGEIFVKHDWLNYKMSFISPYSC